MIFFMLTSSAGSSGLMSRERKLRQKKLILPKTFVFMLVGLLLSIQY
jgi:hypothetical protein